MTNREAQIFQWIVENPMISQEELAAHFQSDEKRLYFGKRLCDERSKLLYGNRRSKY